MGTLLEREHPHKDFFVRQQSEMPRAATRPRSAPARRSILQYSLLQFSPLVITKSRLRLNPSTETLYALTT